MKRILLIFFSAIVLSSCSSVKRGQHALNRGNYVEAMHIAIEKLQKDKFKKSNQEHILILEDAFKKHREATSRRISFLEKENGLGNSEKIYQLYLELDRVQNAIAPLLPLYAGTKEREVMFRFRDYTPMILQAKRRFTEFLYQESLFKMELGSKEDFREAYSLLREVQELTPHYKDTDKLLLETESMGIDYVLVGIKNETSSVLPQYLEQELLNFRTYGLDDFWTRYHTSAMDGTRYDFGVNLHFRNISASPERIIEREIPLEGEVLDGYSYKKDRKGNYLLDSLGNKVKLEHFVKVKGSLLKTVQTKSLAVKAQVDFVDLNRGQLLDSYPVETEFIFDNVFAAYEGDKRLLTEADKKLLNNGFVPFPSDEQMLVDASGDIKARIKPILKRRFR